MNFLRALIAVTVSLQACAPVTKPSTPVAESNPSSNSEIDSIFAPFDRTDSPGCAVGVFRAGEIIFAKGYGMASLEHGVAITPHTPFNVASVSKHITAFAVHLLARRGQLSVDDDIRRHLPELPDFGATVTVRHLLHHTSGLRAYEDLLSLVGWNRDHPLSRDQVLATVTNQRTLGFQPGARFQYANTNYILLAEIVERVSGRPFAEFMAEEIFVPLGMTTTAVRSDPLAIVPKRAHHYWRDDEGDGFRGNYIWAFAYATGASNVITTLADLARWDANFYDERVGGRGITAALYSATPLLSGDSVAVAPGLGTYRGLATISQSGGGGGDYTVVRFPAQRFTVAALCNLDGGADAYARAFRVAELYLAADFESEPDDAHVTAVSLPDSVLRHFTGEYRDAIDPFGRVRFELRDGIFGYVMGSTFLPLEAVGSRAFRLGPATVEFAEPVAGMPVHATYKNPMGRGTLVQMMPWSPVHAELAEFEGSYRSEELAVEWSFIIRSGALILQRPRLADRVLVPVERGTFEFGEVFEDETLPVQVTFTRDANGSVNGMFVNTGRVTNLAFSRAR